MELAAHEAFLLVFRRVFTVAADDQPAVFHADGEILFVKAWRCNFEAESFGRFDHVDTGLAQHGIGAHEIGQALIQKFIE